MRVWVEAKVLDYRDDVEIADACPVCGAPVTRTEQRGQITVDYKPAVTIYWQWACSNEWGHYHGPHLTA